MSRFTIKRATKKDSKIILHFIELLAEYEKLSHEVTTTENLLRENLLCENCTAKAIIGFYEKIPVAFAVYFYNFSTFIGKKGLYLEDIFVLPDYRGKGFGKKMLKYLASEALINGCGRFEWAVLDWNKSAIDFYRSIGAEFKQEWIITRLSGESLKDLAK
jgi:GNAT superfamily N-acetyltransferase